MAIGTRIISWFRKARLLFYLCAVVIVASLLLGGGTRPGYLSDAILQLLAVPLLLFSLWSMFETPLTKQMRQGLWFCLAIALLPLIQLIPLPPWLWTVLPSRQPSAEAFDILGRAIPWMPTSVSPQLTWLSALSVIPPLAVFLGVILLGYHERRLLSLVLLAVGNHRRVRRFAPSRWRTRKPATVLRNYQPYRGRRIFREQKPFCRAALLPDLVSCSLGRRCGNKRRLAGIS